MAKPKLASCRLFACRVNSNRTKTFIFRLGLATLLSWIAIERTDFSPKIVSAPWIKQIEALDNPEIKKILSQRYRFLGKGRQSFAFVGEDGKSVLKFFNRRYIEMPWYSSFFKKEKLKRDIRRQFYSKSYLLADEYLKKETGLLYVHFGRGGDLPVVALTDKASRVFDVDLNEVPFVLQKKGETFYPALKQIYKMEGLKGIEAAVDSFFEIVSRRISLGISDADHDVEHNFGLLEGKPFHLDPGRFSYAQISKEHEWWRATHRFCDFLQEEFPEAIPFFKNKLKTNLTLSEPPPPGFQALQKDG